MYAGLMQPSRKALEKALPILLAFSIPISTALTTATVLLMGILWL